MTGPRLRDDLESLEGYHSPQVDVAVRLNTNESPYPPPDAFRDAAARAAHDLAYHRYPDRQASALRAATGQALGQPPERVFCANGSNEVLQTVLLAYGGAGRKALVFPPSYLLHEHIARITGTEVVAGERRSDFTLDPSAAAALVAEVEPDITFLCSPNNPTGMVEPRETIEAVVDAAPGLVVVDEAYGEFAPWSALELVADDRALLVVRTFSKVWSLAAVRLGCGVAPASIVSDLQTVALPYHVGALTQAVGRLALDFRTEMEERVRAIVRERERLQSALDRLPGIEAYPSGANFILFRTPGPAREVWQGLLDRGVLVRDCSSWPGLEGCLRVTVGTPGENDAFMDALTETVT